MISMSVNPCEPRKANHRTRACMRVTVQTILGFTSLHSGPAQRAPAGPDAKLKG